MIHSVYVRVFVRDSHGDGGAAVADQLSRWVDRELESIYTETEVLAAVESGNLDVEINFETDLGVHHIEAQLSGILDVVDNGVDYAALIN